MRDAVTALGSGYAADAYLVRTAAGDSVLRLAKPPLDRSASLLLREARLLRALERFDLGVVTPTRMRDVRDRRTSLGTLHQYVPGVPYPRGLRGGARASLCADIGRFLAALHAVPPDVARRVGVPEVDLWDDVYRGLIEQALPHLGPAARAWLFRTAEAFARDGGTRDAPHVLVHGDIQRAHLLADARGRLTGVIDFGEAMLADPALDFAGVLNDLGWHDLNRVWAAYRSTGGRVDADAIRRTQFYIAVVPLYRVLYGEAAQGRAERMAGIRQLGARAAAATRRGG